MKEFENLSIIQQIGLNVNIEKSKIINIIIMAYKLKMILEFGTPKNKIHLNH